MKHKLFRLALIALFAVVCGWSFITASLLFSHEPAAFAWMPVRSIRLEMRIEPTEPHVRAWATHIVCTTMDELQQARLAEALTRKVIAYDNSGLVNGVECVPTVAEAIAQGSGNCAAQAIVCASICRDLGIPVSILTKADHAWPVITIAGRRVDLLPL